MTGRSMASVFPQRSGVAATAAPLLEVEGLTRAGEFTDVSFSVRPGEIVGLAGLVGSGRSEILETVYGARRPDVRLGEDRRQGGPRPARSARPSAPGSAWPRRSARARACSSTSRSPATSAWPPSRASPPAGSSAAAPSAQAAQTNADALQMRPADIARNARTLSGGNQQKVVLARWLLRGCKVLLLDEPTRGVDVGARSEIYTLVRRLADEGVAVVVVSSEIEEVLGLADRVLVIAEGRVVHESPAGSITEHDVLQKVMEGAAA